MKGKKIVGAQPFDAFKKVIDSKIGKIIIDPIETYNEAKKITGVYGDGKYYGEKMTIKVNQILITNTTPKYQAEFELYNAQGNLLAKIIAGPGANLKERFGKYQNFIAPVAEEQIGKNLLFNDIKIYGVGVNQTTGVGYVEIKVDRSEPKPLPDPIIDPAIETYNEGETIYQLIGNGKYLNKYMSVKASQVFMANTNSYKATFTLLDSQGDLVAIVDTKTAGENEDLANLFRDSEGNIALFTPMEIKTINVNPTTGIGYVGIRIDREIRPPSPKPIPIDRIETYNEGEFITGLYGDGNYFEKQMSIKIVQIIQQGTDKNYTATFELYDDSNRNIVAYAKTTSGANLKTLFRDNTRRKLLYSNVIVQKIGVNIKTGIGYVEMTIAGQIIVSPIIRNPDCENNNDDLGCYSEPDPVPLPGQEPWWDDGTVIDLPKDQLPKPKLLGNPNAEIFVTAYMDFSDKLSARFYQKILPIIKQEFGSNIEIEFVNFPTEKSMEMAIAGECANAYGKFNEFAELVFKNRNSMKTGFDEEKFGKSFPEEAVDLYNIPGVYPSDCLSSRKYLPEVLHDIEEGKLDNVQKPPTFFVEGKEGTVKIIGQQPVNIFIEAVLKAAGKENRGRRNIIYVYSNSFDSEEDSRVINSVEISPSGESINARVNGKEGEFLKAISSNEVSVKVDSNSGYFDLNIVKKENYIELNSEGIIAKSFEQINVEKENIYVVGNGMRQEVNVLPKNAFDTSKMENVDSFDLKTGTNNAIYEIKGTKSGSIAGILPCVFVLV